MDCGGDNFGFDNGGIEMRKRTGLALEKSLLLGLRELICRH